jgi:hypothetical protein
MRVEVRRSQPSWRAETRVARPELWLLSMAVVGMLLVEVAQSSRMAALSLGLDRSRTALERAQARLDFVRAELERRTTRAQLTPEAARLGLAPLDVQQVVVLPSEYLAEDAVRTREPEAIPALAWAERASRALVPEAMARVRR